MRFLTRLVPVLAVLVAACGRGPAPSYVFVWAGDSAGRASDFLAVIDATPGSARYGAVVASLPVGDSGTHPHHTEAVMPASGHLLANGFGAGKTWLFDLTTPEAPRIDTAFGARAGFRYPHTYVRLADGNVLATFQYAEGGPKPHVHTLRTAGSTPPVTGGLVQMDERGTVIRSGSARDTTVDDGIYPYSVLPIPAIDRAISTTTHMNPSDTVSTARWIQVWRLSDLSLLRSFALEPGPRGTEHRWSGEPFLLPDGSVYIHTFMCGLYRVTGVETDRPAATLVHSFEGKYCGVPILAGRWFLQTVPEAHALVVLDVSDPARPRQVSSLAFGDAEQPHWISMDAGGRRVVLNSGGDGNRLFLVNFDPATGAVSMDERFRDTGDSLPGIRMSGRTWPHGFTGRAVPHGTVFSR